MALPGGFLEVRISRQPDHHGRQPRALGFQHNPPLRYDAGEAKNKTPKAVAFGVLLPQAIENVFQWASTARINNATMLVILIIGFTAGPAVSL
jgi:hypothetical protein